MKNILLTIEYDGSCFHGWQRQQEHRTVQGELEKALSRVLGRDIKVDGTSRTDAGVHAYGQRASFQTDSNVPIEKLPMILNNCLSEGRVLNESIPGEIRIVEAKEMPPEFHARFSSVGKTYIYKIKITEVMDIFQRNYYYQLTHNLDIAAMKKAATYITGTHDFKSFETSGGTERETTVRTIYSLNIETVSNEETNKEVNIVITGDGFLYNMVRIITGTLVEVGLGRRKPEDPEDIIKACDREKAGHTAPPSGLYLSTVYYDKAELQSG